MLYLHFPYIFREIYGAAPNCGIPGQLLSLSNQWVQTSNVKSCIEWISGPLSLRARCPLLPVFISVSHVNHFAARQHYRREKILSSAQ